MVAEGLRTGAHGVVGAGLTLANATLLTVRLRVERPVLKLHMTSPTAPTWSSAEAVTGLALHARVDSVIVAEPRNPIDKACGEG